MARIPPRYGTQYWETRRACSPWVSDCPESWLPYQDVSIPGDGRQVRVSLTPYGSMNVYVAAGDFFRRVAERERERRLRFGLTPQEMESETEHLAEMGISLKGRSLTPLGRPPSPRQYSRVIPGTGKSMAEMYHPEAPTPPKYEPVFAPVPEPRRVMPPEGQRYLVFTLPAPTLQLFCRWVRSSYTSKTSREELVRWATYSIYRYSTISLPPGVRLYARELGALHPVSYATVLALLRQLFGESVFRLTPVYFDQVMERMGWERRPLARSALSIWVPGPSARAPEPPPVAPRKFELETYREHVGRAPPRPKVELPRPPRQIQLV